MTSALKFQLIMEIFAVFALPFTFYLLPLLFMQSSIRNLKILLHFAFFLSGITTILIGQVLPILANRFALNDLQVGFFFPAQFAGSITGTFLASWLGKQNKFLLSCLIGNFLMGVGILMLNLNNFELCLVVLVAIRRTDL